MAETDLNDAAPSRSRLPSPGCLFAVTLLVMLASVCFWIGWRVQRQQARLEYFEQVGGSVRTEPASPVWLHDLIVAGFGEEHAAGFTDITVISLETTQVTDAGLRNFSCLTKLERLYLNHTQITDDGLLHLSGLSNLQVLTLNYTQVTDAGLHNLSGLTNLRWLYVRNTQVTNDGADQLQSQLPGLEIRR